MKHPASMGSQPCQGKADSIWRAGKLTPGRAESGF
jgi:hypothetical protein